MIGTPEGEKSASKRSSGLLEGMGEMNHPPAGPSALNSEKEKNQDAQMSAFLREEVANGGNKGPSPAGSIGSNIRQTQSNERQPRPSFMSSPLELTSDSNSPAHTVAREDIKASAEKILYTFLLPGAEREIILPPRITQEITVAIEEHARDDPEVFDAAKDYVFQAMERDAFPGFLRMKALGNLVPPSIVMRMILGLLALFAGFWASFIFIFMDEPRSVRAWVGSQIKNSVEQPLIFNIQLVLPYTVGVYAIVSYRYSLDPILALAGFSEYTFMNFSRIQEAYIRNLLNKRALMVLAVSVLVDVALCVLFIFVPGYHL
jgi:hypothetical protein